MSAAPLAAVRGGDATHNAALTRAVLDGEPGPPRDVSLLNAAVVLVAAGRAADMGEGLERARESVDSGEARQRLSSLIAVSNGAAL